ncbi:MAG TPA: hypothetical protein PK093_07315 [Phycisphaerae bacterium]|nr:hypothetical protein [Phycisphaerae bacterium]
MHKNRLCDANRASAFRTLTGAAALLLATTSAFGQFTVAPSPTDPLDVSKGAIVVNSTVGFEPGPEAAFGADLGGGEPGNTFAPNLGAGESSFIEVQTTRPTRLSGVRIYARNDGPGFSFRRSMSAFRLLADTDGDGAFETIVVNAPINVDYGGQAGNLATPDNTLELEFAFAPVIAEHWRVEFEQSVNAGPFSGVRIIEVDGVARAPGAIVQPVGFSKSYATVFGGSIGKPLHVIDQSGLSQSYISGETEFDTYVATTSHANSNQSMMLVNSNGQNQPNGVVEIGGTFTLDLGESLPIDALALWAAANSEVITAMAVYADSDNNFDNGGVTLLDTFDVAGILAGRAYDFPRVETRFLHIEVLGHAGGQFIRHGEFAVRIANNDGDMNCDGVVDVQDIAPFATALIDAEAYATQFQDCDRSFADMNGDGIVNGLDTSHFVKNLAIAP